MASSAAGSRASSLYEGTTTLRDRPAGPRTVADDRDAAATRAARSPRAVRSRRPSVPSRAAAAASTATPSATGARGASPVATSAEAAARAAVLPRHLPFPASLDGDALATLDI